MYGYLNKETGQKFQVSPKNEDRFFKAIESLTSLDRAIAKSILEQRPIEHPSYRFFKQDKK